MQKSDNSQVIIIGWITTCVVLAVLFNQIAKLIPPYIGVALFLGIQQFCILPLIIKRYLYVKDGESNWTRFVPIYNETLIIKPFYAWCYLISSIVLFAFSVLLFMDLSIIHSIFGENISLQWASICLGIIMFSGIVSIFSGGLGYCSIIMDINDITYNYFDRDANLTDRAENTFTYICLFIPGFKILSLVYVLRKLDKLVVATDFKQALDDESRVHSYIEDTYDERSEYSDLEDYE